MSASMRDVAPRADVPVRTPVAADGQGMTALASAIRLADGRDLIYFDDSRQDGRDARDSRRLPPGHPQSELRYDPFQRTWVTYARHRQDRSYLPTAADCPLCPSADGRLTEIPASDYQVVVFENRFPALTQSPAAGPSAADGDLLVARPSAGRCEVICYTSDHDASFADLSPARARLVTEALIDRTEALSALPGVEQVFCFENRGREIGVTQPHPHGQIYAYPFVTPRTAKMLGGVAKYAGRHRAESLRRRAGSRARGRLPAGADQRSLGRVRPARGALAV